jgi:hypothetical protein
MDRKPATFEKACHCAPGCLKFKRSSKHTCHVCAVCRVKDGPIPQERQRLEGIWLAIVAHDLPIVRIHTRGGGRGGRRRI